MALNALPSDLEDIVSLSCAVKRSRPEEIKLELEDDGPPAVKVACEVENWWWPVSL